MYGKDSNVWKRAEKTTHKKAINKHNQKQQCMDKGPARGLGFRVLGFIELSTVSKNHSAMQTVRPQSRSRGPDSGRRDLADTRVPAMSPALALTLRKSGQDPFLPRALAVSTVPGLTTPELPPGCSHQCNRTPLENRAK